MISQRLRITDRKVGRFIITDFKMWFSNLYAMLLYNEIKHRGVGISLDQDTAFLLRELKVPGTSDCHLIYLVNTKLI